MKKNRVFLLVFTGIIIGLILYNRLEKLINDPDAERVSLVDSAVAQTVQSELQENQSLSQTRQNAITRAVQLVSPAVVSVNVTKIEEIVQQSPFTIDPWLRRHFPEIGTAYFGVPFENLHIIAEYSDLLLIKFFLQ